VVTDPKDIARQIPRAVPIAAPKARPRGPFGQVEGPGGHRGPFGQTAGGRGPRGPFGQTATPERGTFSGVAELSRAGFRSARALDNYRAAFPGAANAVRQAGRNTGIAGVQLKQLSPAAQQTVRRLAALRQVTPAQEMASLRRDARATAARLHGIPDISGAAGDLKTAFEDAMTKLNGIPDVIIHDRPATSGPAPHGGPHSRQVGGTVPLAGPVLVGERGPEIVHLPSGAHVTPTLSELKRPGARESRASGPFVIEAHHDIRIGDDTIYKHVSRHAAKVRRSKGG